VQVIGAHSADFVWRAGGAVAKAVALGGVAEVIALSYGERGESGELWKQDGQTVEAVKRIRHAEAEAAATASGSGSVSLRRMKAWMQHYDRKDLKSPTFKTWNEESVRNGGDFATTPFARTPRRGDASGTPRAEHAATGGTSPLSVYISSEMNAGSSPEGTPASEISESFEQRMEGSANSVEMGRTTASQLQ
jgi:hypothetical protein